MDTQKETGYIVKSLLEIEFLMIQCLFNYFFPNSTDRERRTFFMLNLINSIPASDKLRIFQGLEEKMNMEEDEKFHNDIKRLIEIRNIVCHSIPTKGERGTGLIEKSKLRKFIKGEGVAKKEQDLFTEFKEKFNKIRPILLKYADIENSKIKAKKQDGNDNK